jgi:hypothetical protein
MVESDRCSPRFLWPPPRPAITLPDAAGGPTAPPPANTTPEAADSDPLQQARLRRRDFASATAHPHRRSPSRITFANQAGERRKPPALQTTDSRRLLGGGDRLLFSPRKNCQRTTVPASGSPISTTGVPAAASGCAACRSRDSFQVHQRGSSPPGPSTTRAQNCPVSARPGWARPAMPRGTFCGRSPSRRAHPVRP